MFKNLTTRYILINSDFNRNRVSYSMIGSIFDSKYLDNAKTYVWGSGSINGGRIKADLNIKIKAVRGPLTRKTAILSGYECPEIYGDPALLLPYAYKPNINNKYKVGIIPHYCDVKNSIHSKIMNNFWGGQLS